MSPSQGVINQTLQTSITSAGLFIQTSSPSGNIYEIKLIKGSDVIPIFEYWGFFYNAQVIDPNTVLADFTIPVSAVPGVYDLQVTTGDPWFPYWNQSFYTLPGAFTVSPPDGYISGTVFDDLDEDGIKDAGEPGLANQSIKLIPTNYMTLTDFNGNYSLPVANGTYSVVSFPNYNNYMFVSTANDTLSVTINNANSTGNDFGYKRALNTVTPDFAYRGMTSTHQMVSEYPIFIPGGQPYGNVYQIRIASTPNIYVSASAITVIDSYTVRFNVSVPAGTMAATNRDIVAFINSGYYGYHTLKGSFHIVTPPAFVSGKIFFDQNQNKLYDPGEPGIPNTKTMLYPDSSIAFSDNSGSFMMGSTGGQQTLSYFNYVSGLVLFTDSSTYTFNATGTITGKNFGFVTTNPDYSIQVKDYYIFPRCFSQQYLYFKVRNTSNIFYNATAWIKKSSLMTYVSAIPTPSSISNDTIYWNISNLPPYTEVAIMTLFQLPGPGNTITFTTAAHSLDGNNVIQQTATDTRTRTVICAMDPNDKQATPEGILPEHFTLMVDPLDYLIRFQNTGNDTAFKVVILDTLDSDLDYSTFEILGSSHSMRTEVEKTGVTTFTFENIMLPDSNVNEPASHGYINYKVSAKSGLPDSTLVRNTAHIYFDFNEAVITNTTFNTLVYVLPGTGPLPVDLLNFTAKPETDRIVINWTTSSETNNAYFTVEKSRDGIHFEMLGTLPGAGTTSSVHSYVMHDKNPLEGLQYYRLLQTDFDGESQAFPPIAVRWNSDTHFQMYPNPSSGPVFVNVSPGFANHAAQIIISDMTGRQVLMKNILIKNQTSAIPLLNSSEKLASGTYLVNMHFEGKSFRQLLMVR